MTSDDDPTTNDVPLSGKMNVALQVKLIGNLRRYVLEANRRAGDAFKSDAIERESRQLADFHLPLDERVGARVAVDAQQQEPFSLLVVAVVGVEDASDLSHHVGRLHRACRFHAPRESQRARLGGRLIGSDGCSMARTTAGPRQTAATRHVVSTMLVH